MLENKTNLDHLIERIVSYHGSTKIPYLEKFSRKWLTFYLEEADVIQEIEQRFLDYDEKGVDVLGFVRVFLNLLPHAEDETLYITVTLIDFFKSICDMYSLDTYATANDVANYIVESSVNSNNKTHIIPTRKIPEPKRFNAETFRVRQIDMNAPIVYGHPEGGIRRLAKPKVVSDSSNHGNNGIKKYIANSYIIYRIRACFGNDVKMIFTLDFLADNICIYDTNCILEKRVYPQHAKKHNDTMILDFAWSNSQQRIGATLKNLAFSFWEVNDSFKFEKEFSLVEHVPDYQTRIWFIDFINLWITTDKTHCLHFWNIEKEAKEFSLSSPLLKSNITDVIPILVHKLIAVSTLDKIVAIWNIERKKVIIKLDLTSGGLHTILWSNDYQVFLTAGYENRIKVWNIDAVAQNSSLIGKFLGHTSMVSSVEVIEKTPMVISSDDSGHVKIWDIRTLNCVQTVELGTKQAFHRLISLYEVGKIVLIGNRINMLEFEEAYTHTIQFNSGADQMIPVRADYDVIEDQFIVCTRKDIRFIDAQLGKIKKVYAGLLKADEDEISMFRLMQQNKKFALGDDKGHIGIYSTPTGDFIKEMGSHQNEITALKIDFANKLVISAGLDSNLKIQKETKNGFEVNRVIKNLHYNKDVSLMEVSIYHNLILTAGNNQSIFIWDYENVKLLACIKVGANVEPTYICFINAYGVIVIADTSGKISFVHFKRRETLFITFELLGQIDICPPGSAEYGLQSVITKILVDLEVDVKNKCVETCKMYASTNKGEIKVYEIIDILEHKNVQIVPHTNTRLNYNCHRNVQEDFLTAIHTDKLPTFDITDPREQPLSPTRKGAMPLLTQLSEPLDLSDKKIKEFKAHQDALTSLSVIYVPEKEILTTSLDSYLKIWSLDGILLCSLNINHPLPIKWDLDVGDAKKYGKKIFYAMKVLDTIIKTNKRNMFFSEEKVISINPFLKNLCTGDSEKIDLDHPFETASPELKPLKSPTKQKTIILMKDEYTPRDMQFDKVKHIYRSELQGPSLKKIEMMKHVQSAKKAIGFSLKGVLTKLDKELMFQKETDMEKEKQKFLEFLTGESKNAVPNDKKEVKEGIKMLSQKLERVTSPEKSKKSVTRQSKIGFDTTTKRHLSRLNGPFLTEAPETSPDIAPFSAKQQYSIYDDPKLTVKLQDNPSLVALSTKVTTSVQFNTRNSIMKPTDEVKSPRSQDFYLYARRKVNMTEETSLPLLLENSTTSPNAIYAERYGRKMQKKNFKDILNKLQDNKKRSQYTSSYFFTRDRSKDQPLEHSIDNSRTQMASERLDHKRESNLLSYGNFVEKQRNLEGFKSFHDELRDYKDYVQGTWNVSQDDETKKRTSLKETLKKISQHEGNQTSSPRKGSKFDRKETFYNSFNLNALSQHTLNSKSGMAWRSFKSRMNMKDGQNDVTS